MVKSLTRKSNISLIKNKLKKKIHGYPKNLTIKTTNFFHKLIKKTS